MSFDAGALLFKIQTVGAQQFRQDQSDAEKAIEKTGKASAKASSEVDQLGKSTDETAKKSKSTKAPLDEQSKSTETLAQKTARLKKEQAEQARLAREQAAAAKELSAVLLITGAAVAALVGLSVAKSSEFGAAMSNVRAATMATVEDQKALGEAALNAGADTAYSASEAAAAEEELAKAGQSVSQIIGGSLNGSLALAAAGQLEVARSAEIMATTLTQFRLPAEQAAHVSDVLAAGAGKAQGSVDDLALALSYVGPLAGSVGLSLNETAGTIAYFATQGVIGEKAGTSLRGVLASLQAPSALAAKEMEKYNISVFDGNGNMKSMAGIAEQLKTRLGGLTEQERLAALGRIFGNESLNAATLLYEGGAEKVNEWTDAVDDTGYAAEQAAIRQDNLAGDIEKLGGAFDTALIRTGTNANDVLRTMTQGLTELVDMYGEAPEPIQATALILGVATAAMLLFAGGAVGARVKFLELKATLDTVNGSMGKTALIGGLVGIALTGVIAIVGGLMAAQAQAEQKAESYADALEQGADAARSLAADALTAEKSFLWLSRGSAADAAEKLGLSLDLVADAATGNADALDKVNAAIEKAYAPANTKAAKDLTEQENEAAAAAQELRGFIDEETAAYENGTKKLEQKNEVTDESVETSESAADAYLAEAESVEDLNSKLSSLIDQINEANGVNQDAITASSDYQQALSDVGDQIDAIAAGAEGYGAGLDLATQAGRDNTAMLQDLAKDSQDAATAQYELDGNTEAYITRLGEGRQALIDSAIAMGATQEEAQILADKIYAIPTEKEINILADTVSAEDKLRILREALDAIPNVTYKRVQLDSFTVGNFDVSIPNAHGNVIEAYANGGIRENHVAQLARGGATRIWNEPETGGETYLPHALSKRPRAEQLMSETASIFGGTYIPGGGQSFSGGAVVGGASGPQTVRVILEANGRLFEYIDARVEQPTRDLGSAMGGVK